MNPGDEGNRERQLALYLTAEHSCSYLDGCRARTLFVDPLARIDSVTYQALVEQGFRRSGAHVYRPACRGCARCVPVRIPVGAFQPNRSQRRNWTRNAPELRVIETAAAFDPGHFALYQRYLERRHPAGSMAEDASAESYRRFLVEPWGGETRFLELRLADRLVGVAVTDWLPQGLSAVYTFFDPDLDARGLGTFAVLAQIVTARRLGRPYVYLGYWIEESRKMAYKSTFKPLEAWDGRRWGRLERTGKHGGE
ncbi:arginyltransferase [uncultured Thiodictyon sp.]|uniref:arginyltransferase n=1 Tax=uncultured Thiodictyon sp. TaxID=1846217 RepID=UPI0025DFC5E3|nr:arginyltransferase [uncultured Thiodictyon sp.]